MSNDSSQKHTPLSEYWVRFKTEDGKVRHLIMAHPMTFHKEAIVSLEEDGKSTKYRCETIDEYWVLERIIMSPPAPEYPSHEVRQHITEVFLRAKT